MNLHSFNDRINLNLKSLIDYMCVIRPKVSSVRKIRQLRRQNIDSVVKGKTLC
jgi:hypothetical protein